MRDLVNKEKIFEIKMSLVAIFHSIQVHCVQIVVNGVCLCKEKVLSARIFSTLYVTEIVIVLPEPQKGL